MFHVDPASLAPSPASAAAPGTDAPSTSPRALIEQRIAALTRLAEMGMRIAEAATDAATRPPAPDAPADEAAFRGDPVLAYTRAARAVRQSFALQSHLLDALAALDRAESLEATGRKTRRRLGLERLVDEALHADRPQAEGWEFKQLARFTSERLRDADEQADILGRSFEEVVAQICDDLDLSPDWKAYVVAAARESFEPPPPAGVARGFQNPSSSGLSRGSIRPAHEPDSLCSGTLDPRAKPEDDGGGEEEEEDTFLEWPPPPS